MAAPDFGGWRPWELADLTVSEFRLLMHHVHQLHRQQQQQS